MSLNGRERRAVAGERSSQYEIYILYQKLKHIISQGPNIYNFGKIISVFAGLVAGFPIQIDVAFNSHKNFTLITRQF